MMRDKQIASSVYVKTIFWDIFIQYHSDVLDFTGQWLSVESVLTLISFDSHFAEGKKTSIFSNFFLSNFPYAMMLI